MPNPTNKKELQRFLEIIYYLGNLSNETVPLHELLAKYAMCSFDQPQIDAVNRLKQLVTETPVLEFYNPNLPIKISLDASRAGLGAVIEEKHGNDWHPVAFASPSLQLSGCNYSPLEKATLSIVFACEKFSDYIYGQKFDVYNDHTPLKGIFNEPLSKATARIQSFLPPSHIYIHGCVLKQYGSV